MGRCSRCGEGGGMGSGGEGRCGRWGPCGRGAGSTVVGDGAVGRMREYDGGCAGEGLGRGHGMDCVWSVRRQGILRGEAGIGGRWWTQSGGASQREVVGGEAAGGGSMLREGRECRKRDMRAAGGWRR